MDLELRGKIVLITGGSKGIGLACAKGFAAEGCRVHIAARSVAALEQARASLVKDYGVEVTCHPYDLSVTENVIALAHECGDLDILVNCAGAIPHGRIDQVDDERWRKGWDPKVFGFINLTREVYAGMKERKSGVVVNVIGLAGERHRSGYIVGTSGNAALIAFTRALGAESVDFGVRVVGINPGRVLTDRQIDHHMENAQKQLGDSSRWREIMAPIVEGLPFKRAAHPEECADLVTFLASARASYISATVVTIDAGQSLRPRIN